MKSSLLALTLALGTFTASAGTNVQLFLKGTVPVVLDLSIVKTPAAETLDLSKALSNEKVATITETSNSVTGYKIKAKSSNNGKLVNAGDINSFVSYALSYNNQSVNLNQNYSEITGTSSTQRGTFNRDVKISYSQPANLASGVYSDTVEFMIEAN